MKAHKENCRCRRCGTRRPLLERYWEKVLKTNACWLWMGSRDGGGYGLIGSGGENGRLLKAHRVAWEIVNGPIPEDMVVMHKCDTPSCVRPDHLQLGTVAENNADRKSKGRNASTAGERHPLTKLTNADVRNIRERLSRNETQTRIAKDYSISQSAVSAIKTGITWTLGGAK